MLDPEVVANDSVNASAPIVKILVSEDNENSVTPLLSTDKHGVATEQLEVLHGSLGQRNDGVVIVSSVGHPVDWRRLAGQSQRHEGETNISWLGFFFFLRIAVEVSFSCIVRSV